jgi:hypothetical protein
MFPQNGSVVQERVEIMGTAAHPEFLRYELFFGPCPVSGAEWCGLGDAVFQQVQNGVLGVWNTTAIPDGTYGIQLRVVQQGGNYESYTIYDITVANIPNVPTATPTSLPTIVPPIHTAVVGQLPPITHDLLFLRQYSLMRWNHATGQIEALVTPEARQGQSGQRDYTVAWSTGPGGPPPPDGGMIAFSTSTDGRSIALARWRGSEAYDIDLLDMETSQVTPLVQVQGEDLVRMAYSSRMTISPDGEWVAYIQPDLPNMTPTPPGGGLAPGMILAVRTAAPEQRIEVGYCAQSQINMTCWNIYWSPDSHVIAWNDARGIWLAGLGQSAQLLVANDPYDSRGGGRVFHLWAWSPLGRYALIMTGIYETDAGGYNVLDTEAGRVAGPLPISIFSGESVTWMRNGRLLITRPGNSVAGHGPSAEIWRIDPNLEPMLDREVELDFGVGPENYPLSATQLTDGRLAIGILNRSTSNYTERGLYFVDLSELVPRKVNGLPPVFQQENYLLQNIVWLPDGTAAIAHNLDYDREHRTLLYVPTDGSPLLDLRPVLDEGDTKACCFVWTR